MPYQDMKWLKQVGAVATNEVNAAMGIIVQLQQLILRNDSGRII